MGERRTPVFLTTEDFHVLTRFLGYGLAKQTISNPGLREEAQALYDRLNSVYEIALELEPVRGVNNAVQDGDGSEADSEAGH